eukprot:168639_1
MSAVVWDNNLANGAQNWASKCLNKHDTNVWESIAWSTNPIETGVMQWFSEMSIYNYGDAWSVNNGHLLAIIRQDYAKCSYGPWLICRYEQNGDGSTDTKPYTTSTSTG